MWEFDPDYKDPYLGWQIGDKKFTKNILETIPHRKTFKDIKKGITSGVKTLVDTETERRALKQQIADKTWTGVTNVAKSAVKGIGSALTAGNEESMQSRRGLGSFTPWAQMGLSEKEYKTNLKERQLKKGIGTNEELLQHAIGDTTLDQKSNQSKQPTAAGEVNKEVLPSDNMLNLMGSNSLMQIAKNNPKAFNTRSDQSEANVNEERREDREKGEKDKTKVETKAKPKLSTLGKIHKWAGVVSDLATAIDPDSKKTRYMEEFDPDDELWRV